MNIFGNRQILSSLCQVIGANPNRSPHDNHHEHENHKEGTTFWKHLSGYLLDILYDLLTFHFLVFNIYFTCKYTTITNTIHTISMKKAK